ncbi:hypothetical protein [endosymbiont DhMRE of Dentiscutata heterogama]|uniref:hypothetical protein n=1 Tax=endosymbiont DhMRE of Dentiscutata heterogama TaxID=1609546 RepID=UPI002AD45660|nr:hypothetical protein [endosymbiont DhMRE of Dentiscutata heterogama]
MYLTNELCTNEKAKIRNEPVYNWHAEIDGKKYITPRLLCERCKNAPSIFHRDGLMIGVCWDCL